MTGKRVSKRNTSSRTGGRRNAALIIFATLAPILAVTVIPLVARWKDVLDPILRGEPTDERIMSAYTDVLLGISSDLGSLAIAVIAGTAAIAGAGSHKWMARRHAVVATCSILLSIGSYYAGIRFRFAVAEQIMASAFDFDKIADRMATQGFCLIVAISLLLNLAVSRFLSAREE